VSEPIERDPVVPLPLRTAADTEGDVQRVLAKLEETGNANKLFRVLANSTTAFRPFVLLTGGLSTSTNLPADVREVVILHLAARRHVAYEWTEHVVLSARVGVTDEQRDAIEAGGALNPSLFTPGQRLAVAVADAIFGEPPLDPAAWAEAVEAWGTEGALELLLVAACWGAFVPTIVEAIGLRRPDAD
jgi:alkylhydroperoxidase family enzyme